jgi:hypothetical protein
MEKTIRNDGGSMNDLTKEENDILENEINFISYKRTIQYKGDYIGHEMSMNINPEIGYEKCEKFIRNKVNYLLQESMKRSDGNYDPVNNYKSKE